MPITKTAKRALRGSKRKTVVNKSLLSKLEIAVRVAQKSKKVADINKAFSFADKAKKKKVFHKNKASRIKSALSKLIPNKTTASKTKSPASKTKKTKKR